MNFNKLSLSIYSAILICFIVSCQKLSDKERAIKSTLGSTLDLSFIQLIENNDSSFLFNEFRNKYDFVSVVYLHIGCGPCYERYIQWNYELKKMSHIPVNYSVLFVITGNSFSEFMDSVKQIVPVEEIQYHIMDKDYMLLKNNIKTVPKWILENSVLIDKHNKIRMVGELWKNKMINSYFYEIINDQKFN